LGLSSSLKKSERFLYFLCIPDASVEAFWLREECDIDLCFEVGL